MIGKIVDDRYRIEALAGRGGTGNVYRATDITLNEPVALKLLHHYLDLEIETALTRFRREFRVLARLDHPHIVRARAYGTFNDMPYVVLEFLEGRTLKEELNDGPLPAARLLNIARRVCQALAYLHARSIVHRDLKPGNLMLLNQDNGLMVKLMDFGLVRVTDVSAQLTQEGTAFGTVAYMAPEQAQGLPVDFRADLYALGVIMFEMATGRPPFFHENPAVLMMQQLTASPPPPRQFNPQVDELLEQLILQLLAREPAQRPAGAEWVAARLAKLEDDSAPVLTTSPPPNRRDLIPRVPLIGREPAFNQLNQLWAQARADQGQAIFLLGAAGAGKTRLIVGASLPARAGPDRALEAASRSYRRSHRRADQLAGTTNLLSWAGPGSSGLE